MPRFYMNKARYGPQHYRRYSVDSKAHTVDVKDSTAENFQVQQNSEVHGSYKALVLHPNWKRKRKKIIERDQFKCAICNSNKELQVHHRQYHFIASEKKFKSPWDYPDDLLITLCSKCHTRGHSKFKVPSINI